MRQPTRPFITAYKGRSSKARTSNPWKIEEAASAGAGPSINDVRAPSAPGVERDASYLAALEAADAVFGARAAEPPPVPRATSAPGRVLPNLLQEDVASALPARGALTKTRRARQPAKVAKAVPAEPTKAKPRTAAPAPPTPPTPAVEAPRPEITIDASPRAISMIQRKWVLKTELKAGERWKRRMSRFAR